MKGLAWFYAALCLMLALSNAVRAETQVGQAAPALSVDEFDGTVFDMRVLKGRVVVMNLWATWCGPCREEMPELAAFYRNYHGQGVEVIALSVDTRRRRSDAVEVAKAYRLPAAMLDETKTNGFDVPPYIPVTYVIDKKGVIVARLVPDKQPLTEAALGDIVKSLLNDEAKPAADKPADAAKDKDSGGETKQ